MFFLDRGNLVMAKIEKVIGREIVDSRGNPTVEVDVVLCGGKRGPIVGARQFPPERPPVKMKLLNFVTATKVVISAKAF